MGISYSSKVVRKQDCLGAEVGEEQVLLDMDRGIYISFNPIGSEIWRRLEQPVQVETLFASLRDSYCGDADAIGVDLLSFLATLLDKGLIQELPRE